MPLKRPLLCLLALLLMLLMMLLFLFGEFFPAKLVPPAVAIVAASLALLLIYGAKVEPVTKVLQDLDWRTILFLICLFCLVEAFTKTRILQGMSQNLYAWFGTNLILISLVILGLVAFSSSLLANIPVVAAMLLMVKGYLVMAQFVPEQALAATFVNWPPHLLPMFVAMMFAGTLGGGMPLSSALQPTW
jgi:Na+/H+ antiporter NhaD/arsenite permease-like protein